MEGEAREEAKNEGLRHAEREREADGRGIGNGRGILSGRERLEKRRMTT